MALVRNMHVLSLVSKTWQKDMAERQDKAAFCTTTTCSRVTSGPIRIVYATGSYEFNTRRCGTYTPMLFGQWCLGQLCVLDKKAKDVNIKLSFNLCATCQQCASNALANVYMRAVQADGVGNTAFVGRDRVHLPSLFTRCKVKGEGERSSKGWLANAHGQNMCCGAGLP